jgi:hypothetical protein
MPSHQLRPRRRLESGRGRASLLETHPSCPTMIAPARVSTQPRDVTFGADLASQLFLGAPSELSRPGDSACHPEWIEPHTCLLQRRVRSTLRQAIARIRSRPGCVKSSALSAKPLVDGTRCPGRIWPSMMALRNQSYNWRYDGIFVRESSAIGGRKLAGTRFIGKQSPKWLYRNRSAWLL